MAPSGRGQTFDPLDVRSAVAQVLDEQQRKVWLEKRKQELLGAAAGALSGSKNGQTEEASVADTLKFVGVAFVIVTLVSLGSVYGIIWFLDSV